MSLLTAVEWDGFLAQHPEAHLLQTPMWGDLKNHFGWKAVRVVSGLTGAQVLFRKLPLGFSLAYIPKGPIGPDWEDLLPEIHSICRKNRAIFLRVEPDLEEPIDPYLLKNLAGFIESGDTIQPRQTIMVDLKGSPEDWLAHMKQKTRYNIRLAEKKEIVVTESQDFSAFERLMLATGKRDGFGVHNLDYYRKAYSIFAAKDKVALLSANFQDRPLAMLMVFMEGTRAFYLYGASGDEERQRMPTYLLQFAAMQWAAARGCTSYDLWGIPDEPEDKLESQFEIRSDGLWGVYRFKRGFGGRIIRSCSGYDFIYNPFLYRIIRRRMYQNRGV